MGYLLSLLRSFSFAIGATGCIWLDSSNCPPFQERDVLGAPNSGGGSHKTERLSNRRGVPGVRGEEI